MRATAGAPRAFYEAHVGDQTDDCIVWPFGSGKGYGRLRLGAHTFNVAALACEHAHGPADGRHALHACDNPACFNPRHLRWGSNAENMADREAHGRHQRGAGNGNARLTADQVADIRTRYASGGVSQQALADEHGVTQKMVSLIIRRQNWTDF